MTTATEFEMTGGEGRIVVSRWSPHAGATFVVLLAHGYGEHAARYGHVADRLVRAGAVVYAPDHAGHGRSEGERALVKSFELPVDDFRLLAERAAAEHPGLPVVVLGHSMGGIIATRYAQRYGNELAALVLSGPVVGGNPLLADLLALEPIPEVPIDPEMLSRDPSVGEAYMADPLVYHGGFQRQTLEAFVGAVPTIAEAGSLGGLPTLWIHGEEDPLAPYDVTAAAMGTIGGSKLEHKKYPGARHEIFNETNSDEVLDDVMSFLRGALGGAVEG
ncbi:MAG: lysophospholipase [Actinomycetota bacterium]|nr:lysophospholipase [Actinomycetota bacterium]